MNYTPDTPDTAQATTKTSVNLDNVDNISKRAVLATIKLKKWAGRCIDKAVSSEVIEQHRAENEAGSFSKKLLPKDALSEITRVENEIRKTHKESTLAWEDGSATRLLPAKYVLAYTEKMRDLTTKYEEAVEDFLSSYDKLIVEAEDILGSMFKETDYPVVSDLREKFAFEMRIDPVANSNDFRCELDDDVRVEIQKEIENRLNSQYAYTMKNLWERIMAVVEHMNTKLAKPNGIFQKSMIENIENLVQTLPDLNFMDEENITMMTERLKNELCRFTPEELRTNMDSRNDAISATEDILKSMEGIYA